MIPVLYSENETNFTSNGIGNLSDCTYAEVYEQRNGRFEFEFGYPQEGIHAKEIQESRQIKVKPNEKDGEQIFRIVSSHKALNNITVWKAEHISYDALYLPVRQPAIANLKAQSAIEQLLALTPLPHSFTAYSDITTKNTTTFDTVLSVRSALAGVEGSILDLYGGEYKFDNRKINLLKARGVDSGVEIRYGKNLVDATMERNIANTVTAIYPYATYYDDTGKEHLVTLDEQILYAPNVSKYPIVKCLPYDFTYEFDGEVITQTMLRNKANLFVNSGIDVPDICINVKVANLKNHLSSEEIELIESIGLCDTVSVYIEKLDISSKAKVVAYTYDVLRERYVSIQLGSFKSNIAKDMADLDKVEKNIEKELYDARRKILLKVSRGEVSNQISIEEEGIDISGNRIAINSDYFNLTAEGKLKAKEAEIEGTITSKNAVITGGSFNVNENFKVSSEGKMVAKEAEIEGIIRATDGSFKGTITSNNANITGGTMKVGEKFNVTSAGVLTSVDGIFKGELMAYNGIQLVRQLNGIAVFDAYDFVTIEGSSGENKQTIYDPFGILLYTESIGSNYVNAERTWKFEGLSVSGTKSRRVETDNYNERLLYCYETPTPYFGDIGEGVIDEHGICYVFHDDVFQETIASNCDYQVFLQAYGIGELHIKERNSMYFVVEGTPGLKFGWEVKAVQRNYDMYRLDEPEYEVKETDYTADTYSYLESLLYDIEKESEVTIL